MNGLEFTQPIVVTYCGSLQDTAILVGLKNMRVPIGEIVNRGEATFQARRYVKILNDWLSRAGLPEVGAKSHAPIALDSVSASNPLQKWGWGEEECKLAIRLAGLPLPPSPATSKN